MGKLIEKAGEKMMPALEKMVVNVGQDINKEGPVLAKIAERLTTDLVNKFAAAAQGQAA